MKVLWVGDSPTVSTGFGICTRKVCERLVSAGHDVSILGLSYFGDPHSFPFDIYPCVSPTDRTQHPFGTDRLPILMERLQPDVVILLQDPWNVAPYLKSIQPVRGKTKIIAWLAVDGENMGAGVFSSACPYGTIDLAVTWTEFGRREIAKEFDGRIEVCPLGVDLENYPFDLERLPHRERLVELNALTHDLPADAFIVGCVGRNQYRKRLDLTLAAFSEWVKCYERDNAYLYIYTGCSGDRAFNLPALVRHYDLNGKVILAEPPHGTGIPYSEMRHVYGACDVLLSTSQGEGWWLPGLEAAACGRTSIVADWSGLSTKGGWPEPGTMIRVPCVSTSPTAPFGSSAGMFTIGGIAGTELTAQALEVVYSAPDVRLGMENNCRQMAEKLTWNAASDRMVELIEGVV
jgi:glycosyltransferase involved in cell wall biosynthesis